MPFWVKFSFVGVILNFLLFLGTPILLPFFYSNRPLQLHDFRLALFLWPVAAFELFTAISILYGFRIAPILFVLAFLPFGMFMPLTDFKEYREWLQD